MMIDAAALPQALAPMAGQVDERVQARSPTS
jgi:hypothetical protein